jgi:hypothetical protein
MFSGNWLRSELQHSCPLSGVKAGFVLGVELCDVFRPSVLAKPVAFNVTTFGVNVQNFDSAVDSGLDFVPQMGILHRCRWVIFFVVIDVFDRRLVANPLQTLACPFGSRFDPDAFEASELSARWVVVDDKCRLGGIVYTGENLNCHCLVFRLVVVGWFLHPYKVQGDRLALAYFIVDASVVYVPFLAFIDFGGNTFFVVAVDIMDFQRFPPVVNTFLMRRTITAVPCGFRTSLHSIRAVNPIIR